MNASEAKVVEAVFAVGHRCFAAARSSRMQGASYIEYAGGGKSISRDGAGALGAFSDRGNLPLSYGSLPRL